MPDHIDVKVLEVIIHVLPQKEPRPRLSEIPVSPQQGSPPRLSDVPIPPQQQEPQLWLSQVPIPPPPETDQQIFDYFKNHIESSLSSSVRHTARFAKLADGTGPAAICRDLLKGSLSLVEGSQQLAIRLHEIMKANKAISSGDLAVCLYTDKEDEQEKRYLALMKMDPGTGFRQIHKRDANGNTYITFQPEQEIMPRAGEPLQKCAFIRELDPEPTDYHMLLLDRQIRGTKGLEIATFFMVDFLNAQLALDAPAATAKLYDVFRLIEADLESHLSENKVKTLKKVHEGVLDQVAIDLDGYEEALEKRLAAAKIPEKVKTKVLGRLSVKAFPDRQIQIDKETVTQKLSEEETIWEGDEGLQLVVPATFDMGQITKKSTTDPAMFSGRPYWTITIKTETWKKVP